MTEATDPFREIVKKYPWLLIQVAVSIIILFILLLIFEDLPSSWHNHIASLTVYIIGLALIAQFRIELTIFSNTKTLAKDEKPTGISKCAFITLMVINIIWFLLFLSYNIYQGILGF